MPGKFTMVKMKPKVRDKLKKVAKKKGYTLEGFLEKIVTDAIK